MFELDQDLLNEYVEYFKDISFENSEPVCELNNGEKISIQNVRILLARMAAFMSVPSTFNVAILSLEKKLENKFSEFTSQQKKMPNPTDFLKHVTRYTFMNLPWLLITDKTKLASFHQVLHETLLEEERNHDVNIENPPAKFTGFINPPDVAAYIKTNRNWREEMRISPLLFHGKDTHRIQLFALMMAADAGLFDIGNHSFKSKRFVNLLKLLTCQCKLTPSYIKTIWDIVIDRIYAGLNIAENKGVFSYPVANLYHATFKNDTYVSIPNANSIDTGFFMDPYYTHSYLMTRIEEFSYLAACLTSQFSKAVHTMNELENALPFQMDLEGRLAPKTGPIHIKQTLILQAKHYKNSGYSAVTAQQMRLFYQSKYAVNNMPNLTPVLSSSLKDANQPGFVVVQDGFIFEKEKHLRRNKPEAANYTGLLRQGAPLSEDAISILQSAGYFSKRPLDFFFDKIAKEFLLSLNQLSIDEAKKKELVDAFQPIEINDALLDEINTIAKRAMQYVNEAKLTQEPATKKQRLNH